MVSKDSAPLDMENIAMLQDLMGDEFSELVTVFIGDAERRIVKIKECIEQQNANEVANLSHGLKGSAMNLSAAQLTEYSRQLEQQSRTSGLSQADELITRIEQAFEQVKACLLNL